MRPWLALVFVAACDPAPAPMDAGTDAPRPDAGPPVAERFTDLGVTSEGIALGRTLAGAPVLFVGTLDDRILHVAPDGVVGDFVSIDDPLGIAVRDDGTTLVVCAKAAGTAAPGLFEIAGDGTISTLVPAGPGGEAFGLTNFVAIAPDGSLVFSDSQADRVFRADADGANVALVTDAITYPNGLAFSPDGTLLYVASWDTSTLWALSFDAATGAFGAPAAAHEGTDTVDGVIPTSGGRLVLVTSNDDIVAVDPTMPTAPSTLISPARLIALSANGVFGDAAFGPTELYVTSLATPSLYVVHTTLSAP